MFMLTIPKAMSLLLTKGPRDQGTKRESQHEKSPAHPEKTAAEIGFASCGPDGNRRDDAGGGLPGIPVSRDGPVPEPSGGSIVTNKIQTSAAWGYVSRYFQGPSRRHPEMGGHEEGSGLPWAVVRVISPRPANGKPTNGGTGTAGINSE